MCDPLAHVIHWGTYLWTCKSPSLDWTSQNRQKTPCRKIEHLFSPLIFILRRRSRSFNVVSSNFEEWKGGSYVDFSFAIAHTYAIGKKKSNLTPLRKGKRRDLYSNNVIVYTFSYQWHTTPKIETLASYSRWDVTSIIFCGVSAVYPSKVLSVKFVLVIVVDQMVLGPVNCPARIHCTAVFAQRNCKLSRLGVIPTYTPIKFRPCTLGLCSTLKFLQ